jgi:hypothetical protein
VSYATSFPDRVFSSHWLIAGYSPQSKDRINIPCLRQVPSGLSQYTPENILLIQFNSAATIIFFDDF